MSLSSDDFIEVSTGSERECNGIKPIFDRLEFDPLSRMEACVDRNPSFASGVIPSRSIDGLGVR